MCSAGLESERLSGGNFGSNEMADGAKDNLGIYTYVYDITGNKIRTFEPRTAIELTVQDLLDMAGVSLGA